MARPKRGPDTTTALRRAVAAWRVVGPDVGTVEAELLTGGRHSTAVHLRTGSGPSVVAKLRPRGGLDLERAIHQRILPELGVATPEFLGFAPGRGDEDDVLFLEYVGGSEFQPSDPAHQQAAGAWLGRCHAASARLEIPAVVPRKSPDEERSALCATRSRLSATLENPALGGEGSSRVSRVLELLDAAADGWADWSERGAALPPVLTHGAFITRNVRMREKRGTLTTLPFDWDHVAVRSPAIDLARLPGGNQGFAANASLEPYRAAWLATGLRVEPDAVAAIAMLGTVIRAAACIGWLVGSLTSEHVGRPLAELDLYQRAVAGALGSE
jgi:hypothetical protein